MRAFLLAIQFLTILPVPVGKVDDRTLARSMAWYPVVGLLIGLFVACVYFIATSVISTSVAAFLAIASQSILTGALHIDGAADVCDAFAAGRSRERILEIMKDSHIGAYGVIGLLILFVGKVLFLGSIPPHIAVPGIIIVTVLSRGAMAASAAVSRYARIDGTGRPFIEHASRFELAAACILSSALSGLILWWSGIALFVLVCLWTILLTVYFHRRIGGVTGDTLGFIGESSEWLSLLCLLYLSTNVWWDVWPVFSKWFGV